MFVGEDCLTYILFILFEDKHDRINMIITKILLCHGDAEIPDSCCSEPENVLISQPQTNHSFEDVIGDIVAASSAWRKSVFGENTSF